MKKNYYQYLNLYSKEDWRNGPCSICRGRDQRCSQTDDGAFSVCYAYNNNAINVKVGELGEYGTYITNVAALQSKILETGATRNRGTTEKQVSRSTRELSEEQEQRLNKVNRRLIDSWELSKPHEEYLLNRGFTREQITRQQYRTSDNANKIIEPLQNEFGPDLLKVPGFLQFFGEIQFRSTARLIIPTFNHNGNLINLRSRNLIEATSKHKYSYVSSHQNGRGLKAYISEHVIIPEKWSDERIWITEGEFKAHSASDALSARFISLPGVALWRLAFPALEKFGQKKVVLAFDKDMYSKKEVAQALVRFFYALKECGYEATIANW
jgi:hypothetical protein